MPGRRIGITSGGANGSRPTSSVGGPSAARRLIRASFAELSRPRPATTASSSGANGLRSRLRPARISSIATRCRSSSSAPGGSRRQSRELEHQRQEVRQLVAGRLEPGAAVGLLELQQRQPALAAVAVHVVGEVEAALLGEVEGVDVEALQLGDRPRRVPAAELVQALRPARPRAGAISTSRAPAAASRSAAARVLEQQRGQLQRMDGLSHRRCRPALHDSWSRRSKSEATAAAS